MKVYIDLDNLEDITSNALIKISRKNAKPELVELVDLCSLVDHDKQVRKEVCNDFKGRFLATCQIEKGCDTASFSLEVLSRILDQIQGEKK